MLWLINELLMSFFVEFSLHIHIHMHVGGGGAIARVLHIVKDKKY